MVDINKRELLEQQLKIYEDFRTVISVLIVVFILAFSFTFVVSSVLTNLGLIVSATTITTWLIIAYISRLLVLIKRLSLRFEILLDTISTPNDKKSK